MTKLTKEQIEQERVKFEEWISEFSNPEHRKKVSCGSGYDEYLNDTINFLFMDWLSRAELDKGE